MPETIKMVKFKTNVSFADNNGVFHAGGSVVQLPTEEYDAQVGVCSDFGLPTPELIEEVEAVIEEPKKRGRAAKAEEEPSVEGQAVEGQAVEGQAVEGQAVEGQSDEL
nr:MAG TPA: hypothetical protein [Caudoviricetes sp.]